MSRILRRPMFRGGRVSSYGTGIAAPLVPGYRGGGQIGGGIIYGKPMVDGRYGFQNPTMGGIVTINDILSITKAPMTGQQILDYATQNNLNLGEDFKINPYSKYTPEKVTIGEGTENERDISWSEFISDKGTPEIYDKPYLGKGDTQGSIGDKVDTGGKRTFTSDFGTTEEVAKRLEKKDDGTGGTGGTGGAGNEGNDPSDLDSSDLESMIGRYEKILGGDKAKGQDVADMLLTFAGSKGDTTMDKFQEFFATEAKKGPSRTEKIKQAAAMLGIKGEQAQKLYETKLKNQSGQTQKAVEFIQSINPGMDADTALRLYLRQPASFAESLGIYKNKEGFLSDEGFLLAAGTFHRGKYKGNRNTDGSMEIGEEVDLADGVYTDKINRIIWTVKDKKVIESSGDRYKTTTK